MEKRFSKNVLAVSLSCALVVVVASLVGADTPKFSDWSNRKTSPDSEFAFLDQGPFISKDGLSFYFASTRPGCCGDNDFWVSQRASVDTRGTTAKTWAPLSTLAPESRRRPFRSTGTSLFRE